MLLNSKTDVIKWIINNQLGRRNLTPEMRKYLIGKKYEMEKKPHGGDRKSSYQNDNLKNCSRTCKKIAKEFKTSQATVVRAEKFAKAVDKLAEVAGKEVKHRILTGEIKASQRDLEEIVGVIVTHYLLALLISTLALTQALQRRAV